MQHNVLILDFGSQYTQLIARRVRELNIFCEIFPYNHFRVIYQVTKQFLEFSVREKMHRIQTYLKLGVSYHACSMLWGTILSSF
jgi:hypothetical protein